MKWILSLLLSPVLSYGAISPVSPGQAISAEQMNAVIAELNNLKSKRHIVFSTTSGTNWYEIYSDGWVRQGGRLPSRVVGNVVQNANFVVALKDTSSLFSFNLLANSPGLGAGQQNLSISAWTTTGFSFYTNDGQTGPLFWSAEGWGSSTAVKAVGADPSY